MAYNAKKAQEPMEANTLEEKRQMEKAQLKLKLQAYGDIWEYKKVKVGPFTYTKKVPKASLENQLKEERGAMMAELDPEADKVPEEPPPQKPEDEDEEHEFEDQKEAAPSKKLEAVLAAMGPVKDDMSPPPDKKKKEGGLFSRFKKLLGGGKEISEAAQAGLKQGGGLQIHSSNVGEKARAKKKKKRRKRNQDEDAFDEDEPVRIPTPETHPVYRQGRMKTAERPQEGFPWDLRLSWHTYRVYISSTHEDMLSELKALFAEIIPQIQEIAAVKRVKIIPIYLQDGLSAREVHRCTVAMRLREIERCNCVLFLQGRTYGDCPTDEAINNDVHSFPWLADYPTGRSFQEYEAAHVIPDLRKLLSVKLTQAERKERDRQLRAELEEGAEEEPDQLFLLAQRGFHFMDKVPPAYQKVFKDPEYSKDLMQRQLRTRCAKGLRNIAAAEVLTDYKCEFMAAKDDGLYEIAELHDLHEFIVRETKNHIYKLYPDEGPHRWLKTTIEIDQAAQQVWAVRSREFGLAHSREAEIEAMTRYCDSERSITPLLVVGGTGTGKTALMLRFLEHYADTVDPSTGNITTKGWRYRSKLRVESHFTAVSSYARNPTRMLHRFCSNINAHYHLDAPDDVPKDYVGLAKKFVDYSHSVGTSFRGDMLLVMVDSLEELDRWGVHAKQHIGSKFSMVDWIPDRFLDHPNFPVRLILSLDPTVVPEAFAALRRSQHAYQVNELVLQELSKEARVTVLSNLLKSHSPDFDATAELAAVVAENSASSVPMYNYYATLEITSMSRNKTVSEMERFASLLPTNLSDMCVEAVSRLEVEFDGGSGYVRDILMLLTCTRRGLLDTEVWELIKMKAAKQKKKPKLYRCVLVIQALKPFLQPQPKWSDRGGEACLQLLHSFLSRIVTARYVKNVESEMVVHRRLAELFYQGVVALNLERIGEGSARWLHKRIITDDQARGLSEVCYHTASGRMVNESRELLCSLRFVELRLVFDQLPEILEDYRLAVDMYKYLPNKEGLQEIGDFSDFVRLNAPDLVSRPSNTFQAAANAPIQTAPAIVSRAMLTSHTEKRVWLEYRNKVQDKALASSFSTGAMVLDLSISVDSRMVGAVSADNVIHIYDTFLGTETSALSEFNHNLTCSAFLPQTGSIVSGCREGFVTFWDTMERSKEGTIEAHTLKEGMPRDCTSINKIKVANDMRCMVTAANDHTLKLTMCEQVYHPESQDYITTLKGHRGPVLDVDISIDSLYIVSASADKTLRVWSCDTHEVVQQCVGHLGPVLSCSFGGSNHETFCSSSTDTSVRTWQTATGVVISLFRGHVGAVNGSAMGVTGPQVVSAGEDGTVRVWDTADGSQMDQFGREHELQTTVPEGHKGPCKRVVMSHDCLRAVSSGVDGLVNMWNLRGGHEKQINHVAFTVDRTRVVTCSSDKTLRTFDIQSTTELTKIVGHVGSVTMCDISPGETSWVLHNLPRRGRNATTDTCVVASASEDCSATLYNVNTGMTIHKLAGHIKAVHQVAFTPDGKLVATASADTSVRIWDAVTGECKHTLLGHTGDINAIQFLQDNRTLLSVSNDTSCRVWDIENGLPLALLSGHTLPVTCLDYSPGSDRAITGSRDKTLRLWNLWKAAGVKTLRGHTAGVLSIAFSRNGRKVFSGGRDKCIRVWSVDDNHHKHWAPEQGYGPMMEFAQLRKPPKFPGAKVLTLSTAPNDRYIGAGYDDGILEIVQLWNHMVDLSVHAHEGPVTGTDFSKDSTKVCTCGMDRVVKVFKITYNSDSPRSKTIYKERAGQATSIEETHSLSLWPAKEQWLYAISWNGDDTEVAVACEDSIAYLVDVENNKFRTQLKGHTFRVTCLTFHPDGIWLSTGSYDKSIAIWHAETGLLRSRIHAFGGAVLCVKFLPFGPFLCAGSVDRSTRVFHILTGEQLFSLSAHALAVRSMSISADGVIATASDDKEIRLWDCRMPWGDDMGTQLAICEGHKAPITCCKMTHGGGGLLSAAEDWTIMLWDVLHGAVIREFVGHTGPVTKCYLLENPNEEVDPSQGQRSRIIGNTRYVISASMDGTIRVWDITTGFDVCFSRTKHPLLCLAKTDDNTFFAAGDSAGGLHIFRLRGLLA